ncbi:MAG: hypothetical protein B6U87_00260 [Candidatus Aenigmarchaeota archaeon ex4484_52]|nr:MAG: hypothetical protein B6U87_00260 [Candidatus Aenigmarchaeota archaeon ex4484_52]
MIKAVVFDLDNTLIDFMKFKNACIEESADAMIDAGINLKKEILIKKIHKLYNEKTYEYRNIFSDIINQNTSEKERRDKILANAIIAYRRVKNAYLETYPGTRSVLLYLIKKNIKLAIVSDAPRMRAYIRLCSAKLQDFFDVVVTFDDTKKTKPSPEPFLYAIKKLNLKPNQCIYVGDNQIKDIVGAKKLGFITIFAKYGTKELTKTKHYDYEISNISELRKIIDSI